MAQRSNAAKGAAIGGAAGSVVPGVGTAVGSGVGAAIGAINFGGGGEKGSGQTKPQTLAHAIDKIDRANDIEALNIAPMAVEAYIRQGSPRAAAEVIENELGNPDVDGLMRSHKWDYIYRMLKKEASKVREQLKNNQQTSNNNVGSSHSGNGSTSTGTTTTPGPAQQSGFGMGAGMQNMMQYGVFGLVGLILVYVATQ